MYCPNIAYDVVFCIFILAWASCVAYPLEMGMREPEVGISKSTDSHVFFYVLLNQGMSIGLIYMDYAEERKINW